MNILLFGESSTGKSSLASRLKEETGMTIFTGKDYLKLKKNKDESIKAFKTLLEDESQKIIYVATEKNDVQIAPESMVKVLCKASLETKIERFGKRFRGQVPKPVIEMIKRKDGMYDHYKHELLINEEMSQEEANSKVKSLMNLG